MSSTPLPEPEAEARPARLIDRTELRVALAALVVAFLAIGAAATGVAGCGGPEPKTIELVVPAGTQDRLDAGEDVSIMPARLEMRVGDVLVIRNEDDVTQSVGPYTVGSGAEMRFEYGAAGVYEGYCPLSDGDHYEIVVTE